MKKIFSMCLSLLISSTVLTPTSLAVDPPFTQEENQRLIQLVEEHGDSNWSLIASFMENRDDTQCKDQWENYLAGNNSENVPSTQEKELESILNKYCNSGFSKEEVFQICDDAIKVLENESSLLEIDGPTIVVGDLHGDLKAFEYCCKTYFLDGISKGQNILFLGDYVDRGENGIEITALLLKLKTMFPNKIFLLRGNHESINMNKLNGFAQECKKKYKSQGNDVLEKVNEVFNYLSLAAVVNKYTFCVHGGISPCLSNNTSTMCEHDEAQSFLETNDSNLEIIEEKSFIEKIDSISKPYFGDSKRTIELVTDLLWSDPNFLEDGFNFNFKRRAGKIYGKSAIQNFLKANGLKRVIRAHEVVEEGYKDVFENGSLITIFSSPGYRGYKEGINSGAVALVTNDDIKYEVYTRGSLDNDIVSG